MTRATLVRTSPARRHVVAPSPLTHLAIGLTTLAVVTAYIVMFRVAWAIGDGLLDVVAGAHLPGPRFNGRITVVLIGLLVALSALAAAAGKATLSRDDG